MRSNPISQWTGGFVYRSVSLWEMVDILHKQAITGRRSRYWKDPRENCGIFFGDDFEKASYHGAAVRKYVGTLPIVSKVIETRVALDDLHSKIIDFPKKRSVASTISTISHELYNETYRLIDEEAQRINDIINYGFADCYVLELYLDRGVYYTGDDSLAGRGGNEICLPHGDQVSLSAVTKIFAMKDGQIVKIFYPPFTALYEMPLPPAVDEKPFKKLLKKSEVIYNKFKKKLEKRNIWTQ